MSMDDPTVGSSLYELSFIFAALKCLGSRNIEVQQSSWKA